MLRQIESDGWSRRSRGCGLTERCDEEGRADSDEQQEVPTKQPGLQPHCLAVLLRTYLDAKAVIVEEITSAQSLVVLATA
jgi:hypothetical protein